MQYHFSLSSLNSGVAFFTYYLPGEVEGGLHVTSEFHVFIRCLFQIRVLLCFFIEYFPLLAVSAVSLQLGPSFLS